MDRVRQVVLACDPRKFVDHFRRGQVVGSLIDFEEDQFDIPDLACQVVRVRQDVRGDDVGGGAKAKRIRHHAPIRKASNTTTSTTSMSMPNTSPVTPPIRALANHKIKAAAPTPARADKVPRIPSNKASARGTSAPQ